MGRIPVRWRTARLRLTALYGALFLASGATLLAVTDILVARTTADSVYIASGSGPVVTATRVPVQAHDLQAGIAQMHDADVRQFAVRSAVALGLTALAALGIGYGVAGRVLRPVRRLEHSFHAQRRFIANASHELRTPLARQRAIAEVALDDPDATTATLRAAHERIVAANAQQERIIEALLALARGQAGIDRRVPFDLAAVVRDVLTARTPTARTPTAVTLQADLRPAPVRGDPSLAERLVTNLVDNALRYNVPDGHLRVETGIRDERAILLVGNSGPPVPADAIDRLFEPFTRLDPDRTSRREGLGLGLSIVQAIAEAHDAVVTARPGGEGGLVVEVAFPKPL